MRFNQYTAQATTSCVGTQLSVREMALGLDRYDMPSDRGHGHEAVNREVTQFKSTTLGAILSSDKFIKYDMLARNVINEGYKMSTKVQVGFNGKVQEIRTPDEKQFRQVGTSYYGDISEE
jgi:hypothetical protein